MKVALIDLNINPTFKDGFQPDVIPIYIEDNDAFVSIKEKIASSLSGETLTNILIAITIVYMMNFKK
jgi:hypothetical protein